MWFKIIFVYLIIILNGSSVNALEPLLTKCCLIGEHWADNKNNCSDYKEHVKDIPIEMQGICLSSVEICCSRSYSIAQCQEGIKAAQSTQECNLYLNETGSNNHAEYFKDCCEGCKIGIVVGSSDFKCTLQPFGFSPLVDTSFERCCNEMRTEDYIVVSDETELCSAVPSGKLCEQICVNTPNSYRCECEPGYVLMENNVSCKKLDDEANEVDGNVPIETEGCGRGYEKSSNGTCVDIDECDTGEASCDINTESCFNKAGGYICIRIVTKDSECQDGYRFNTAIKQCQDINECLEDTHACHKVNQICMNTVGGYSCQEKKMELCLPGLEYNAITKQCDDINECQNVTACDYGLICVNTLGSFKCSGDPLLQIPKQQTNAISLNIPPIPMDRNKMTCAPGYTKRADNCVDIDECVIDKNSCDSHQNCINMVGSFRCECKIGFILDTLQNACVDVNECQVNTHDCLSSQRCDNTIGSYNCIRLQGCGTGYTLNAATGRCEDDDECAIGRHNCEAPYECRNTMGSFRCQRVRHISPPAQSSSTTTTTTLRPYTRSTTQTQRYTYRHTLPPTPPRRDDRQEEYTRQFGACTIGFERNSHGACVDVNECDRNACRSNQKCVNTNGSYRCENFVHCATGYIANEAGTGCIDLDECETGGANCGPDQLCRNKPGGYICYCPQGHFLNKSNRCEDIDECSQRSCPMNANCINTIGSYSCECKEGFRNERNEFRTCVDVDECTEINGLCEQKCINYWGSYRCACQSGYRLSDNNRTCEDLDECEINKSHGLCMGDCENTPGSYRCTCPTGYRLGADDRSCHDIDECQTQSVCRDRNEICTNIRGGHRCSRIDCPHGYVLDSERRNRCKLISLICDQDDMECLKRPTTFSYNFITLVSNMSIQPRGRALFNFKGPNYYDNIDFEFRVVYVNAPATVRKANLHYFEMQKMSNEALLSLMRTLEGPQDIELEMSMTVYREGQPSGTNVAKIFIIVSEYNY